MAFAFVIKSNFGISTKFDEDFVQIEKKEVSLQNENETLSSLGKNEVIKRLNFN